MVQVCVATPQSERGRRRPNGDDRGPPLHRRSRSRSRSRDMARGPPRGMPRDDGSGSVGGGGGGAGYARDGPPARAGPPPPRDFPPQGYGGRPPARSRSRSRGPVGGGGGGGGGVVGGPGPDRPFGMHERSRERYGGPADGPRAGGERRADSFPRNREPPSRGPGPDDRRPPARADAYRDEYHGSVGSGVPPRDLDRVPAQGFGGGGGGGGRGGDAGYGPKGGDPGECAMPRGPLHPCAQASAHYFGMFSRWWVSLVGVPAGAPPRVRFVLGSPKRGLDGLTMTPWLINKLAGESPSLVFFQTHLV
jgi:hypothetical protein